MYPFTPPTYKDTFVLFEYCYIAKFYFYHYFIVYILLVFTTCSLSICYMYIWELAILLVNTQYFEHKLVSINVINDR